MGDLIGVTEAGFKAQQMNALLNVKKAEKRLQFGETKCKSMLISKNSDNVLDSNLMVDKWDVQHVDNPVTGDTDIQETYLGLVPIEKTDKQKYLGFMISSRGDNMINIKEMKNKSTWVTRKIFTKLDSLNLKKYYFECGILFLNTILRSSILYACETYYNLKETEVRQLEMLEEGFLRRLLKTSKGCPISQLYLETGHYPARFEIKKIRLLFLKYILNENPESLIYKFLQLQLEKPTRGDWASSCINDLKELKIEMSFEDIKMMKLNKFRSILKKSVEETAFSYLIKKQGSKGQEIIYSALKMAEYLMPNPESLSIDDKRNIFEITNRMVALPNNFSKEKTKKLCTCGKIENMEHVYLCINLNKESPKSPYESIFKDDIGEQLKVCKRFKLNFEQRSKNINEERMKLEETKHHEILFVDPLSSLFENSNGNK